MKQSPLTELDYDNDIQYTFEAGTPYVVPMRGLDYDPILKEMSEPSICETTKILSYADNTAAPCEWVEQVMMWAETTDLANYLNLYVTDVAMRILNKYRNGEKLTPDDINFVGGVNTAIYSAPRTNTPFPAIRGVYVDKTNPFQIGQILTYGITRSGTININEATAGYLDNEEESALLLVKIPKNAILAYHPSEDQVIFPIGAKFCITSDRNTINIPFNDEATDISIYECVYIDAPNAPEVIPRTTSITYYNSEQFATYSSMFDQENIFPYRVPDALSLVHNNKLTWTIYLNTYSGDLISGMLFAANNINILNVGFLYGNTYLISGSNNYTVTTRTKTIRCSNIQEFMQGVLTICNAFNIDFQTIITDITDQRGVHYTLAK